VLAPIPRTCRYWRVHSSAAHDPVGPPGAGRVWIDPLTPDVLWMAGEVDLPVVRAGGDALTADDLNAVDVVDLTEVTFIDSSVVALLANLLLRRPPTASPLVVRNPPDLALVILEISGLLSAIELVDRMADEPDR
jgi:ABC-type transporter Mla MlaB component